MFDKIMEISMLYDFYGQLLPEKQRIFLQRYHEENYSLSEIGQEFGISRQGVHDGVKKAEKSLHDYEEKLGLVGKFTKTSAALMRIDSQIDSLIQRYGQNGELIQNLSFIKQTIDELNE